MACELYEPLAEEYSTDGIISGVLTERYLSAGGRASGIAAGVGQRAGIVGGGGEIGGGSFDVGMAVADVTPFPPALTAYILPPPLPPPVASAVTQGIMSVFSLGMGGLMAIGFFMCAYCFFSQDIKKALGMHVAMPHAAAIVGNANGGLSAPSSRNKRKGKKARNAVPEISVTVVTTALTQTKDVPITDCKECDGLVELLSMLSELFPAVLRDKRKERLLLQCRLTLDHGRQARAVSGEPDGWLLVTHASDLEKVLGCPALRVLERPPNFSEDDYPLAFVMEAASPAGDKGRRPRRPRPPGDAGDDDANIRKGEENSGPTGPSRRGTGRKARLNSSRDEPEAHVGLLAAEPEGRDDEDEDDEDEDAYYERMAAEAAAAAAAAAAALAAAEDRKRAKAPPAMPALQPALATSPQPASPEENTQQEQRGKTRRAEQRSMAGRGRVQLEHEEEASRKQRVQAHGQFGLD